MVLAGREGRWKYDWGVLDEEEVPRMELPLAAEKGEVDRVRLERGRAA